MSLTVVSTPIGNFEDITLRAIDSLKKADIIICEELKPARVLLKRVGLNPEKALHQLNEHSRQFEIEECLDLCRSQNVALISDCGTPGFCDPGALLVDACLKNNIKVEANPGPSSLMTLLSVCGAEIHEFYFVGFLPAEKIARQKKLSSLKNIKIPLVVMDTPYRIHATLNDFATLLPRARGILGIDLTGDHHRVLRDDLITLQKSDVPKAPFVLIVL